ncbi:MAG TPA: ABC transporter permease [Candidatus Dormibacteraeota bacterium]|nr:ABC transporter permease [Candidatus Dormibacteraeota bacterium]HEX2682143.1 ABC transporter permease [Candidatus Dormibacteraeota bacterium]
MKSPEAPHGAPAFVIPLVAGLLGAVVATVLALLTFGVQATVDPHQLPLAVGTVDASAAPALGQVTSNIASQGGDRVAWRQVDSRAEAETLLDQKEIYGAVLFSPGPGGLTATILVSGAINPNATSIAEPLLIQVAVGVTSATQTRPSSQPAVQVVTLHATSAAGRTLPLAGSALLWLATLVPNIFLLAAGPRLSAGKPIGPATSVGTAVVAAFLGTGVVLGLAWLWDSTLSLGWEVAGFLLLVGTAFAFLQAGVLRWLGLAGMAVLGPLYLMAPAVSGLAPELLNSTYKTLLWTWTPFRFSAEALRSLMFLGPSAPDVQNALLVFAGIALAGLLILIAPRPQRREAAAT